MTSILLVQRRGMWVKQSIDQLRKQQRRIARDKIKAMNIAHDAYLFRKKAHYREYLMDARMMYL